MTPVLITADAFAALMLAIILYASLFDIKRKTERDRIFAYFVGVNLLLSFADMLSWVLEGKQSLIVLNYAASYVTICGAFPATYLFARYLLANADAAQPAARWQKRVLDVYTTVLTVVSLVLCATGNLFTLDGGHYETTGYYTEYLLSVFIMYLFVLFLALRSFRSVHKYELVAFIAYSLSPFIALVVEVLVPSLSLSYAATAVSILVIYIMLQSAFRVNAQEREQSLIERGNTDEMTGINNRRAYSDMLEKAQAGVPVGVVFCDLNGLKYFNDTYGHKAGDKLIITFVNKLKAAFDRDCIYRISGDEFVVACRDITPTEFMEKVALIDRGEGDSDYRMAAIGHAYGDCGIIERLINQAEESMYVQKTVFHRQFPKYIRKGSMFLRYISDDTETPETLKSAAEADPENTAVTINHNKSTLLLIEDSENHDLIRRLLESDYNVIDVPNVSEALTMLEMRPREIAIVLIDTDPPKINGLEFLQMKQANPDIAGIPVIVTCQHSDRSTEARYLRLGAFDFIHRPYSADMLLNRLQRTIEMMESAATLNAVEKDELTGVYTRQVFCHMMRRKLERETDAGFDLAVFDVQNFKLINEHYGEKFADTILQRIGTFLLKESGEDGLAGRYAGDQFMLFLPRSRSAEEGFWDNLVSEMEKYCALNEIVIKCGIYADVEHTLASAALCYRVLLALRSVKHQYGKNGALFNEKLLEKDTREQQLEVNMEAARDEQQFKVFYQPKCDVKTGRVVGAEALLRWKHPVYGFLPPDEFIPLFERNGFIIDMDLFAWNRTAENLKRWQEEGLNVPHISVNASHRDFGESGHLERMLESLRRNGIQSRFMHIEVTESMFAEHADKLAAEIKVYRDQGIQVELDDFGCGYSALNVLGSLPIDVVKFDKKFIDLYKDPRSLRVLASAVSLVKSLNLSTVVEGVETQEQHDIVEKMGADMIQGYFYSRPLPEDEFEAYLKREKERIG